MNKSEIDFQASLKLLFTFLKLYNDGELDMYKPISAELRKLICDNKNSLLPRVRPDFKLHKLHITEQLEKLPDLFGDITFFVPGRLSFNDYQNPKFTFLFSNSFELISIEDWVKQIVLKKDLTIFELVKSVADKESVHSDIKYNETLLFTKNVRFAELESQIGIIIGIAEYILKWYSDWEKQNLND